jgi:DNA mismatch endonuclease (patch repair protein)
MQEQDHAAGGREKRRMHIGSGRVVHASVYFRRPQGRRVYAYLRWADAGRTRERCVGEITHATRDANLAQAWHLVAERGLLTLTEPSDPAA